MALRKYFLPVWLGFTFLPGCCFGQQLDSLPALFPSNITAYDLDDGMPISCTWDGLLDKQGRFWATACFGQTEHRTVNFYQFDGERSEVIQWEELPEGADGQAALAGVTAAGKLYGFFRGSAHFFLFDPDTRQTQFHQLGEPGAVIFFMEESPEYGLILLAASPNRQWIYRLTRGKLEQLLEYRPEVESRLKVSYYNFQPNFQVLSGDYLWFLEVPDLFGMDYVTEDNFRILRFSLRDWSLYHYTYEEVFSAAPPPAGAVRNRVALAPRSNGRLVVSVFGYLYQIDPEGKATEFLGVIPHHYDYTDGLNYAAYHRIEKDDNGNLVFIFPDSKDQYLSILVDSAGQYFNYTPVVKRAMEASRFPKYFHHNVWGKDFKRNLFAFHPGGIISIDLQFQGAIAYYLTDSHTRSIAAWKPDEYLVRPENRNTYFILRPYSELEPELLSQSFDAETEFHPMSLSNTINTGDGYWWYSSGWHLVHMDSNQRYTSFPLPANLTFVRFTFLNRETAAFVGNDQQLYFYNWTAREINKWQEPGQISTFQGAINELYLSRDSTLWIASLEGLWQVDLKARKSRKHGLAEGFLDERIMCIHEGEGGSFWLGTYGNGLHIYNPQTGSIQIVNQERGLSNNTVIGILADEEGVRWVSTFKGLNLVSGQGQVLAQLYEEDGLSTNEFNRYSYFKDAKGRLLFGSIKGVNIIEPELVKEQLRSTGDLRIYLTSITRYDPQAGIDTTQYYGFESLENISLPATHRYLTLNFALSDMVRPEDQGFAYKIERPDVAHAMEWNYLGNQSQLSLQDLSSGQYKITIRGSDYRGNWTSDPLVIRVQVSRFFYQQFWFYLVIFLLVTGAVLTWMIRQRLLRKRLEAELAERTGEIMAARDQLIVQEKLASLGQMVAGIAHEIKNPLNFIQNFSIGSQEVLEEMEEKLQGTSKLSDRALADAVSEYVTMLKEYIETIRESGARLDAVVTSMMDHARDGSDERVVIDINELVELNVKLAHQVFKSNHAGFRVSLRRNYDPADPVLRVFPNDLARCLLNLVDNACYAVFEKSKQATDKFEPMIRVSTLARPTEVEIRLRDNGPGINEELQAKIFTPFFTTKPTGTGNIGLGLSICYDIVVKRHGGSLQVESKAGEFTEFIITLPSGEALSPHS